MYLYASECDCIYLPPPMNVLDQISAEIGVSRVTVQRVLTAEVEYQRPTFALRAKRIRERAKELGYFPHAGARAISTGSFDSVALVAKAGLGPIQDAVNTGVQQALEAAGKRMVYSLVHSAPDGRTLPVPRVFREMAVDGAIFHYAANVPPALIEGFGQMNVPAIFLNTPGRFDCVYPDDREATRRLTRKLIHLGHEQIAYSGVNINDPGADPLFGHYSVRYRLEGYRREMLAAGLEPIDVPPPLRNAPLGERIEVWKHTLATWSGVTAWIIYSHMDVAAFVAAATARRLQIPRDVSLASFSFHEPYHSAGGNVSAMRIPFDECGREAVALLLRRIADPLGRQPSKKIPFADPTPDTLAPRKHQ